MCLASSLNCDIGIPLGLYSHLCGTVHELRVGRMFEFGKICMRIAIINDNATVPIDLQVQYIRRSFVLEK